MNDYKETLGIVLLGIVGILILAGIALAAWYFLAQPTVEGAVDASRYL